MFRNTKVQISALLAAVLVAGGLLALHWAQPSSAGPDGDASGGFAGRVQGAGNPIAGSTVTLYVAGDDKPTQVAQGKSGEDGTFTLDVGVDKLNGAADKVLYLVARGGTPKGIAEKGANDAIALLSVLGTKLPKTATVNELTTVASTFTAARFIDGEAISGKRLGLGIAAGNAPNLVDPETGSWGKVLLDPLNSTQTTALANLNTLGCLLAAFNTQSDNAWRERFLKATTPIGGRTPKTSLEAIGAIARRPWANTKELYALFDEAYPQPKDGARRKAPFLPYLAYTPQDFALSLCFSGDMLLAAAGESTGRFGCWPLHP